MPFRESQDTLGLASLPEDLLSAAPSVHLRPGKKHGLGKQKFLELLSSQLGTKLLYGYVTFIRHRRLQKLP